MINDMFKEFNTVYGFDKEEVTEGFVSNAVRLISEEVAEASEETESPHKLAKELTDIVYQTLQKVDQLGFDAEALLQEVHRSNMSKTLPIDDPSVVIKQVDIAKLRYPMADAQLRNSKWVIIDRETGKVIKPTTYSEAVITDEMVGM